ncbi:hypothetical protein D9X91_03610 [Falsibacillus albus]|uniref:Uncharacterized protein n=1 Tax=Falsibacillus albus TaxID=2478915 RepID=A0A3L7K356_9BACI|nr:hypothetical protein D9X91_03610 [Falsibacillus albus]
MRVMLVLLLIGFVISVPALLLRKLEGSMKGFFQKGFGGLGDDDSTTVECPGCHRSLKRGNTPPYCDRCRRFF